MCAREPACAARPDRLAIEGGKPWCSAHPLVRSSEEISCSNSSNANSEPLALSRHTGLRGGDWCEVLSYSSNDGTDRVSVGQASSIIIVAALVFAATFDVNRYRATIQSELENRLGRKVTLGNMHLSVFPPRLRVLNISISDDPRFSTQKPFVQAQQLDVSVKLLPLLTK